MISYIAGCSCEFHQKMNRQDRVFDTFTSMVNHCIMEYYTSKKYNEPFKILAVKSMNSFTKEERKEFVEQVKIGTKKLLERQKR